MKVVFIWLFLGAGFITKGQYAGEYINIPLAETYSTVSIAKFIQSNFKTDTDKLRAAYSWVTANIKYDSDSMYVINLGKDPYTRITAALKRRKGVCENFAAIFNDIVNKCGIRSYEVTGYTKQHGVVDKASHTWCVVQLEGQWFCCDPTWDIGLNGHTKYFLQDPAVFIESHMPFDPLWQLLDHPVTHKEFYSGFIRSKKNGPSINFKDSIDTYIKMNELPQLESTASRIAQAGIANELVKTRLAWIQMEISINYQEKNMTAYNSAVIDFNNANSIYNSFIRYRNDRFIPLKTDREINAILLPMDDLLLSAGKKLDLVDSSVANFQYDTGLLRNRLNALTEKLKQQRDFLRRYFASTAPEREKLFYSN